MFEFESCEEGNYICPNDTPILLVENRFVIVARALREMGDTSSVKFD